MGKLQRVSRGDDHVRTELKKRVAVSTDGDQHSNVAWTGTSSDTRLLKNMSFLQCRIGEDNEVQLVQLVRAQNFKSSVVLPLVWEKPDVIAYVKLSPSI